MKYLPYFSQDDQDFFGPGTDLVLSLAAILVISLFIAHLASGQESDEKERLKKLVLLQQQKLTQVEGKLQVLFKREREAQLNIGRIRANQMQVIRSLARLFETDYEERSKNQYGIDTDGDGRSDILIENDATIQRMRFGSNILFDDNRYEIRRPGRIFLRTIAAGLKEHLDVLEEIQLQGHADIRQTSFPGGNLGLAAQRAMQVFWYFRDQGIDPARHLMSATTFAEFKPIQRRSGIGKYSPELLRLHNGTAHEQDLNRRIEIILIYTSQQPSISAGE